MVETLDPMTRKKIFLAEQLAVLRAIGQQSSRYIEGVPAIEILSCLDDSRRSRLPHGRCIFFFGELVQSLRDARYIVAVGDSFAAGYRITELGQQILRHDAGHTAMRKTDRVLTVSPASGVHPFGSAEAKARHDYGAASVRMTTPPFIDEQLKFSEHGRGKR